MRNKYALRNVLFVIFAFLGLSGWAQCNTNFTFYSNSNTPYTVYINQPNNNATDGMYIWNWFDGSSNDTTYYGNTNSPSLTHNFPAVGTYSLCVTYVSASTPCNVFSCQSFSVSSMTLPAKYISIVNSSMNPTWSGNCPTLPDSVYHYVTADVRGYTPSDSIISELLFGDGSDSTVVMKPHFYSSGNGFVYVPNVYHVYATPGLYSSQYTMHDVPGTTGDTITQVIDAQDSCGNLNGVVYLDINGNCMYDVGDSVLSGLWVSLQGPGSNYGYGCTTSGGFYNAHVPVANTYTLSVPWLTNYGYTYACGGAGLTNVTAPGTVNIGVVCPSAVDLTANLWGWRFRPGDSAYVNGWPANFSCIPQVGTVTLTLDPNTTFMSEMTGAPVTVGGNQVSWNYSNLTALYNNWMYNGAARRYLKVNCSTNLQIGDSVCYTLSVDPVVGDAVPANNTITKCYPVQNSWDPNFKEVYPRGVGAPGYVAQNTEFTYTIHFQNTGNAAAYNIAVLDTIDADLDLSTFQVIGSSHHVQPQSLSSRLIKFHFNNIMLPDSASDPNGSQGWVTYKIKAIPGQPGGTQYTNTAYIYFDFNPAIITNTTLNTVALGTVGVNELSNITKISVAPNPVGDITRITLQSNETGKVSIQVLDMLAQVVKIEEKMINKGKNVINLDTQSLPEGMYLLNLVSNGSVIRSIKIIK